VTPDGRIIDHDEWEANIDEWLPNDVDRAHVASLMAPVREPGRMAAWIAPPTSGIHAKPVDFEYVRA
jgi:benzoyl-CoA 2,3-dioxygenase component B